MTVTKQIGRYMLPLGAVVAIQKREGFKAWLTSLRLFLFMALSSTIAKDLAKSERSLRHWPDAGYDATLNNGHVIHFTEEEKAAYLEALEWHELTLQFYGAAKGMGLRA